MNVNRRFRARHRHVDEGVGPGPAVTVVHPRVPGWLIPDLRSDHAGETGAVSIYGGILKVTSNAEVADFARAHLETEKAHLALMNALLPVRSRSRLLVLWRIAGWLTGALPALFGPRAVFATIAAVETFVDHHYARQVALLREHGDHAGLADLLERCRLDEVGHRDEARASLDQPPGVLLRLWCRLVGSGSASAVALARRF